MKLLLFEPRQQTLWSLRDALEANGHEVITVASSIQLARTLGSEQVDAVLVEESVSNTEEFQLYLEVAGSEGRLFPFVSVSPISELSEEEVRSVAAGSRCAFMGSAELSPLFAVLGKLENSRSNLRIARSRGHEETDELKRSHAAAVNKLEERILRLEKANAELREGAARFHATLENLQDGYELIDREWRYLYVNRSAAALKHKRREDLVGRTLMDCHPGIEHLHVFGLLQKCMLERTPARMESEISRGGGKKVRIEITMEPVPEGILLLSHELMERVSAVQTVPPPNYTHSVTS